MTKKPKRKKRKDGTLAEWAEIILPARKPPPPIAPVLGTTTVRKHAAALGTVYIGRGSRYGNPFSHIPLSNTRDAIVYVPTINEAIELYGRWIIGTFDIRGTMPPTLEEIKALKGKALGCFCLSKTWTVGEPHGRHYQCHGQLLAEIAERGWIG